MAHYSVSLRLFPDFLREIGEKGTVAREAVAQQRKLSPKGLG